MVNSSNTLFNKSIKEAVGDVGKSGDAESIVWAAQMLGEIYEKALKWARRIRCARIEPPFDGLGPEMALLVDNLIQQFNDYPSTCLEKIKEALESVTTDGQQSLNLKFVMELANLDRFNEKMSEVERKVQER